MRIAQQILADGSQPFEDVRTRPFHYAVYNLEGWACLARMMQPLGFDPWSFRMADGRSLMRAVERLMKRMRDGEGDESERRRLTTLVGLSGLAAEQSVIGSELPNVGDGAAFRLDQMWWARALLRATPHNVPN
jgi:hypothetical protein